MLAAKGGPYHMTHVTSPALSLEEDYARRTRHADPDWIRRLEVIADDPNFEESRVAGYKGWERDVMRLRRRIRGKE